jgi:prephenate dehydrogenase
VDRLHCFWQALGCKTAEMQAEAHDEIVARISHLPHAAAVLTALAAFRPDPSAAQFAAGGLRDTTRVASGDPDMWCEILLENREALLPVWRDFREAVDQFTAAIESNDAGTLRAMLTEARRLRATRYP